MSLLHGSSKTPGNVFLQRFQPYGLFIHPSAFASRPGQFIKDFPAERSRKNQAFAERIASNSSQRE
jgi:hypothetical protein